MSCGPITPRSVHDQIQKGTQPEDSCPAVGPPTSSPESFAELMGDMLYLLIDERTKNRVKLYPPGEPGTG